MKWGKEFTARGGTGGVGMQYPAPAAQSVSNQRSNHPPLRTAEEADPRADVNALELVAADLALAANGD